MSGEDVRIGCRRGCGECREGCAAAWGVWKLGVYHSQLASTAPQCFCVTFVIQTFWQFLYNRCIFRPCKGAAYAVSACDKQTWNAFPSFFSPLHTGRLAVLGQQRCVCSRAKESVQVRRCGLDLLWISCGLLFWKDGGDAPINQALSGL